MKMFNILALSALSQIASADDGELCGLSDFDLHWNVPSNHPGFYDISPNGRSVVATENRQQDVTYWTNLNREKSWTLMFSLPNCSSPLTKVLFGLYGHENGVQKFTLTTLESNKFPIQNNRVSPSFTETYVHFEPSYDIKVQYDADYGQLTFTQNGSVIHQSPQLTNTSAELSISFKATVKGQELLINSDRAIAKHCSAEYKKIVSQCQTELSKNEKFNSELKTQVGEDYTAIQKYQATIAEDEKFIQELKTQASQDYELIQKLDAELAKDEDTISAQQKEIQRCNSGLVGRWGGQDDVHAIENGTCLMFSGDVIRDGRVDAAIEQKVAQKGARLEEGSCASAGFTDRVWFKQPYGVTTSVWTR